MNLKKIYLLSILIMVVAFVTNISAQTANHQRPPKPSIKVKTNPPKPPMYLTCGSCGGSGKKSRYNIHNNQYERVKCTACSGSGRRRR